MATPKETFAAEVAMAKSKLVLPNDDALKAKAKAIAGEIKTSTTSGRLATTVLVRVLGDSKVNLADKANRTALLQWLMADGHGLGCNASQFGQWVNGGAAKSAVEELIEG